MNDMIVCLYNLIVLYIDRHQTPAQFNSIVSHNCIIYMSFNPFNAGISLYKTLKPTGFFIFEIINGSFSSFCVIWISMVYGLYKYFNILQHGDRFYTSESDVYKRQIMTSKDGPRASRNAYVLLLLFKAITTGIGFELVLLNLNLSL